MRMAIARQHRQTDAQPGPVQYSRNHRSDAVLELLTESAMSKASHRSSGMSSLSWPEAQRGPHAEKCPDGIGERDRNLIRLCCTCRPAPTCEYATPGNGFHRRQNIAGCQQCCSGNRDKAVLVPGRPPPCTAVGAQQITGTASTAACVSGFA